MQPEPTNEPVVSALQRIFGFGSFRPGKQEIIEASEGRFGYAQAKLVRAWLQKQPGENV